VAPLGFVVVGFQKPSPPPEATVLIPEKAIFKYDAGDVAVPSQGPTPRVVHDDNLFGGFTVQSPQFVLIPAQMFLPLAVTQLHFSLGYSPLPLILHANCPPPQHLAEYELMISLSG
jgi:hypothetical protein